VRSTFTTTLEIPEAAKAQLMAMSPATYIGNAAAQANDLARQIKAMR
jgi:adenylosuccinate lyase